MNSLVNRLGKMSRSASNMPLLAASAVVFLLAGVVAGVTMRPFVPGIDKAQTSGGERAAAGQRPSGGPSAQGRPSGGQRPGGPGGGGFRSFTPAVTFLPVETAEVTRRIDAIGSSRSAQSVQVISEVNGLVDRVHVKAGDAVAKGDLILSLDAEAQQIELNRLRAQYPIARDNAERYRALLADDAASAIETEGAFNSFKILEADLRAAEYALSRRRIAAPFSGIVGLIELEPGDYINTGERIASLDDTESIVVEFRIPQELANVIVLGQSAEAAMANAPGERVEGLITAVDTRVDQATRTLRVEATFPNDTKQLIPGAAYTVSSVRGGPEALSLPPLAVQWDRGGAFVWKIGDDGVASQIRLTVIQRTGDAVLASGQLAPGDIIVFEGADRVRAGMQFDPGQLPGGRTGNGVSAAGAL